MTSVRSRSLLQYLARYRAEGHEVDYLQQARYDRHEQARTSQIPSCFLR